jgi:phospholipase C
VAGDAPRGALSRREFLERTAYGAGLAGVAALPAGTILSEAAKAQARGNALPSPRNLEIDHFVVLMMENRSFDHYFGWLSGEADAVQNLTYPDPSGNPVATRHASWMGDGQWQGCARIRERCVRAVVLRPRRPRIHP